MTARGGVERLSLRRISATLAAAEELEYLDAAEAAVDQLISLAASAVMFDR